MPWFLTQVLWLAVVALAQPGDKAPSFNLRDIDGKMYSLDSLARPSRGAPAGVVVLDVMRSDCPACRKALPDFLKLQETHAGATLRLALVAVEEDAEGQRALKGLRSELSFTIPVLSDKYGTMAREYVQDKGPLELPVYLILDCKGFLRFRGAKMDDAFGQTLSETLAECR